MTNQKETPPVWRALQIKNNVRFKLHQDLLFKKLICQTEEVQGNGIKCKWPCDVVVMLLKNVIWDLNISLSVSVMYWRFWNKYTHSDKISYGGNFHFHYSTISNPNPINETRYKKNSLIMFRSYQIGKPMFFCYHQHLAENKQIKNSSLCPLACHLQHIEMWKKPSS